MAASASDLRVFLQDVVKPSVAVSSNDQARLKGYVCALRAHQADGVLDFIRSHDKRPILSSYSSDSTPQSVAYKATCSALGAPRTIYCSGVSTKLLMHREGSMSPCCLTRQFRLRWQPYAISKKTSFEGSANDPTKDSTRSWVARDRAPMLVLRLRSTLHANHCATLLHKGFAD